MWSGRGRDHGASVQGGLQRREPHEVTQQVDVYVDRKLLLPQGATT